MNSKISVIIPLYNKEHSIEETIESVLSQTYQDFELIIVNDGSTDNSMEIVSTIKDERIIIITRENKGVSTARNTGILESKGEWIFLLDADDLISDNCLSTLIKLSVKFTEATVLTGNINQSLSPQIKFCTDRNEKLVKKNMKSFFFYNIFPRTGNTLIKKTVFHEIGLFSTDISFFEDFEFDLRLLRSQVIAYAPEVVFTYVQNSRGLSITDHRIECEYAYYAQINEGSFFEQMLILENILLCYKRMKNIYNTEGISVYKGKLRNLKFSMLFLLKFFQYFRRLRNKIINITDNNQYD
jgi:glycosyltransferase involved in cell wall biosynthesis